MKCPKCQADNPDTSRFCGNCATKLDLSDRASLTRTLETTPEELRRGILFAGRYEIIEELGTGGMGRVYRAHDTKLNEEVALKLIKPEIAAERRVVERFRNELRTARKITHKNVCRMHDLHEEGKTLYLTMEYVRGEDLKSFIKRSKILSTGTALSIARQVAEGLSEAHKLGIVHRDLKPGNIMIDKEGQAKIMDFGIARSLAGRGTTAEGAIIGTPEYMSPEQVEGKEADQRADIYALGIILFEMVTGRVPFEGETPFSIANKQKSEPPPDPRKLNPQVSGDLSRIILCSLEKAKEKRYQTTGQFLADLGAVEKALPTGERISAQPKPKTSREITVKFSLKKLLIPSLVTIALIMTAIFVWRIIPQKAVAPARSARHSIAVLPFEDLSPTKDHEYLCDGIAETLINSLSNIKDLWIPARASSFSFKGKNLGIREIGKQLGVDNLLEASVQVIGKRLRITPKIIKVNDGSQIWSSLYDRQMEDVFAIQDEIAREIVRALKITLLGEKEAPLIKSYTKNLQAYNLYLQGRYFANQRTGESLHKAITFFNQAVDTDRKFALAYVGLADCYVLIPQYTKSPNRDALLKSEAAVSKALEIDDGLGEAHATQGLIWAQQEWKWGDAEREFQRALELNPNYSSTHQWYALLLQREARLDEGLVKIRRAVELDPLSPLLNTVLGRHLFLQNESDPAIQQYRKALQLNPNFALARMRLGEAYLQKGLVEKALAELQAARTLFGQDLVGMGQLGHAYALSGENGKAMEQLTRLMELSKQGYSLNYDIALVYLGLGDREKSLEWLGKAVRENEVNAQYVKVDPDWENLRSDPRFRSLLKMMNLE